MELLGGVAPGLSAGITTCITVKKLIEDVKNAPNELEFLYNEVTDTSLVLCNIRDDAQRTSNLSMDLNTPASGIPNDPEDRAKFEFMAKRVELILSDIRITLFACIKSKSPAGIIINQGTWLRNKSKLRLLCQQLRETKMSLAVHFSACSSIHARRAVILLNNILSQHTRAIQQQSDRADQIDASIQKIALQLAHLSTMPDSQERLVALLESINISITTTEGRSKTITTSRVTEEIEDTTDGSQSGQIRSANKNNITSTTVTEESVSRFKLEFSRFQKRGCDPSCSCSCHIRKRYKTPAVSRYLLGEFFVGFSNLPFRNSECLRSCSHKSPFSATFTYYLPPWLLRRMVSLVIITTSQGDPAACLKTRPLSQDFAIYKAVETNKLSAIQNLLSKGLAHPSAAFRGGWTPLHYAISYGYSDICKSLLAAGADPLIEDGGDQLSALEWAWQKILGGSYEDNVQQEMEQLFSDRDCLEEWSLTELHRIVVGLSAKSSEKWLSDNPNDVNKQDAGGRTALSWASQRGMGDAVRTLLLSGADPNICTPRGNAPLLYAAEARTPECLLLLLQAGADVTQHDGEGQTALHYAAKHTDDLAYYMPLVEAGCNLDVPTRSGTTSLVYAITEGWELPAKYLAEQGADINRKGQMGRPPIFYAVEYNNHYALRYLSDNGADLTAESEKYPTIAHIAAHHADAETVRILAGLDIQSENVDCIDTNGMNIEDIIAKRLHTHSEDGEELLSAFSDFLRILRTRSKSSKQITRAESLGSSSDEGREEDVFSDAVEYLPDVASLAFT